MIYNLAKVILFPIIISMLFRFIFKNITIGIEKYLPIVSMISIVITISIVVSINAKSFFNVDFYLFLGVVIHNLLGLIFGYFITRLMGFDEKTSRTISLEVGLQNSGLAIFLAIKFFTPASALAGVIFSVWHNISGSLISSIWSHYPLKSKAPS
jgi:BASS family bile acid:Na+ symporter